MNAVSRPTVLIADDNQPVLERLVALLSERFTIIGTVSDGRSLIDAAIRLRPAVIVTDVTMPGLNGLEALALFKAAGGSAKIIVLTMHADAELAEAAIRAGASGFLVKMSAGQELVKAIDEVLAGRTYVAASVGPVTGRE